LKAHASNPRYFSDDSGKAVYLTGSHTWNNLQEVEWPLFPVDRWEFPFDYHKYLDWMHEHNHNFMRLWNWEHTAFFHDFSNVPRFYPNPFARTGPGNAKDGLPRFDISRFDDGYFHRLRQRVELACDRGIYVSVMLFQGFSIFLTGSPDKENPWDGHPLHRENNINGFDGDPENTGVGHLVHTLQNPAITALQESFVARVIDTVNDLDNVLYEIANEARIESVDWQYHMISFIKRYEGDKPKRHPVGMTAVMNMNEMVGKIDYLIDSPADWISPGCACGWGDWLNDPPAADGRKIIISDTDHLWGEGGDRAWVWKSFCRGINPIYMDNLKDTHESHGTVWDQKSARKAMGDTLRYAERMDLASTIPSVDISSTGYCLANEGKEYLVYNAGSLNSTFTVDLAPGKYTFEWFNPAEHTVEGTGTLESKGGRQVFQAPCIFNSDAVLYLSI